MIFCAALDVVPWNRMDFSDSRFIDLLEDSAKKPAGAVPIKWFSKANLDEAKYWLKKVVHGECEHKILGEAHMLDAQEKLKEIEEHEKAKQQ